MLEFAAATPYAAGQRELGVTNGAANQRIRLWVALGLFVVGSTSLTYYAHRLQDRLRRGAEDTRTSSLHGQAAPDFTLPVLIPPAGAPPGAVPAEVRLADHQGKIVFISFWASWCRPCHYELPLLNQFYLAHRQSNVEVIAISTDDDRQAAVDYAQKSNFAFPMVWDADGRVSDAYRVEALPSLVVVNPEGKVWRYEEGMRFDLEAWLREQVRVLSQKRPAPAAPQAGG
ncbi:MAG: TlpA family protein disulfide reductase [Acidobacteria bacterium]|nr:TlpA family protein disulfide reductase [Acidobacteriota bacterium]